MASAADAPLESTATSLRPGAAPFTRHAGGAVLVVVEGPDRGMVFPIGNYPLVIGRLDPSDLILNDPSISRKHLKVEWDQDVGAMLLTDLGSTHGSFFHGDKFDRTGVAFGDEFGMGSSILKVLPREEVLSPLAAESNRFGALVGDSPAMRQLFTLVEEVAASRVAVLLEGDTGVGKELVAEELHGRSDRRDRPFVVFDCGSVPEKLIESTLFGYVKGAFTGADADRPGVFSEADTGTLFLDEIGELSREHQPALLRALDKGMVRPVGSAKYDKVDVRIVAATHHNLGEMVEAGDFREDLYFRLAVLRLRVPPLRDRTEDIELLVRHFLRKLGRPDLHLAADDLALLTRHTWPGNVRELRNVVERGAALAKHGRMVVSRDMAGERGLLSATGSSGKRQQLAPRKPFRDAKAEAVTEFEHRYLENLMAEFDTVTAAADAAEMDRKHLRNLLRRHGLLAD